MVYDLIPLIALLGGAGVIAGFTAGLFGNGGGFITVPTLLLVFPLLMDDQSELMLVAVGTSLATIVVLSSRSLWAHAKHGAVDFKVLKGWSVWILLGVVVGLYIASFANADGLVVIFATGVSAYAVYFLFPGMFNPAARGRGMPRGITRAVMATGLGGFSSLLGIGGGTFTALVMMICNRPMRQAVATASGMGLLIGLPGATGFMLMGLDSEHLPVGSVGYINIPALLAISLGAFFTAPLGARWTHRMDENHLKRLFGIYLVIVAIFMYMKAMDVYLHVSL